MKLRDLFSKNKDDRRIKILDSVRAYATTMVFLFHAGYLLTYNPDSTIDWLQFVHFGGTVGVSIFFVLSGFLLFYQIYRRDDQLTKSSLKTYAKKRALRILPLYYFSLFFIVLVLRNDIIFAPDGLRSIFYNLIFIRGIHGGGNITINPVYWTLIIELHFYIILPIVYYIFYRSKKLYIFFTMIAAGLLYRFAIVNFLDNPSMQLLRLTPSTFDFFAFGMLGAYVYKNKFKYLDWLGRNYVQILSLLAFIAFIYFYDLRFLPTWSYILAPTLFGFIATFSMVSFLSNEKTLLSRAFTVRPIVFIAEISFSIYIWHAIVIEFIEPTSFSNIQKFIINIVLTLIISTITYYAIEAPFLKFKERRFKKEVIPPRNY